MSAALWLDDMFGAGSCASQPGGSSSAVLTIDGDVIVNIAIDDAGCLVHFYSALGYAMESTPGAFCPISPTGELESGSDVTVSCSFRHEDSNLVMLLRSVPRHQLDSVRFRHELKAHAVQCMAWSKELSPTPCEPPPHRQTDLTRD